MTASLPDTRGWESLDFRQPFHRVRLGTISGYVKALPKPNTVQLVNKDLAFRRLGGLWMVLVVCAFGGPFENFALDDTGVGAGSAYRVDAAQQFGDALIPQSDDCGVVMRGKKSCGTVIFG